LSPAVVNNGPSYLWTLYTQGKISSAEATFWINDSNSPSYVTFGGTPTNSTTGDFIEQSIVSSYDSWWTMRLSDVKMNGSSIKKSGGQYAIVDTGTSLLYMLTSDYAYFETMVEAASPDFNCNSAFYDYCYSNVNTCDAYYANLQNLTIFLNGNEYTITPQGYTLSNGDLDGHKCAIAISAMDDSQGLYILGDTFLRNFVSTYDYKKKAVRLAVNINAPVGTQAIHHIATVNILFVVAGAIIAFILLYCCCKSACKKKKGQSKVDKDRLTDVSLNENL